MAHLVWNPRAQKRVQKVTVTVGGSWSGGNEAGVKIGGAVVSVIVGTTTTTSLIAQGIAAAINATDLVTDLAEADQARTAIGQEVPQVREVTATYVSGSTFEVVGPAGVPFEIFGYEVSASGTVSTSTTQAATGPWHFDNANNWSGLIAGTDTDDTVPGHDDYIYYLYGDIHCKYNLNAAINPSRLVFGPNFRATLGLPPINRSNINYPYAEYRNDRLRLNSGGVAGERTIVIGQGNGDGSPMLNIEWLNVDNIRVTVFKTGTPIPDTNGVSQGYTPEAVNLWIENPSFINVMQGFVALNPRSNDDSDLMTMQHLRVGRRGASNDLTRVSCGIGTTFGNTDPDRKLTLNSGTVTYAGDPEGLTVDAHGGALSLDWTPGISGTISLIRVSGASVVGNAPVELAVLEINNGGSYIQDYEEDTATNVFHNLVLRHGATFKSNYGRSSFTQPIRFEGCGFQDVTLDLGRDFDIAGATVLGT